MNSKLNSHEVPNMKKMNLQDLQRENKGLKQEIAELRHKPEPQKKINDAFQISKRNEDWFRQFMQLLPQTIFEIDLEGNFRFLNEYSYEMFGYSKDDKIGTAFSMMVPEDHARISENMNLLLQGVEFGDREYTGIKKDGSRIPVLVYARPLFENSVPIGFYGIILEITERKKIEKELIESNEKYQNLTEQLPLGVYRTSLEGRFLFANEATARILGYSSVKELMAIDVNRFYTNRATRQTILRANNKEKNATAKEFSIRKKDGSIIWIRDSFRLHKTAEDNTVYLDGIIEDITDRKILEDKLNQSLRLQSIGTLAGGIAHDFNNLIMGMQLFTELAMKSIKNESPAWKSLEKVAHAQVKAKNLVEQILSFSRKVEKTNTNLQLKKCIEGVLLQLLPSLPKDISVKTSIHPGGRIKADYVAIERILQNLIHNAVHAMNNKGQLEISLRPASLNDRIRKYPAAGRGKDWIKLTVQDDGKGMNKQTRDRIFDPFFTTKKVGTGSGLGLTIVHSLVEQLGGIILLDSAPQKGTRFYIYLPVRLK